VRRTSSIDVSWPDGQAGNRHLVGRARDVVTLRSGGAPIVQTEDSFEAFIKPDRTIVAIEAEPARPALSRLNDERGGGRLREAIESIVPEERRNATPLYLLLDDISGVSLVSSWAWSQWDVDWLTTARAAMQGVDFAEYFRSRVGICSGFAPGSSAFNLQADRSGALAPDLRNPDDAQGWHAFTRQDDGPGMRRARRIDVWVDDVIVVDSAFQDSASRPEGGRAVVHEYSLTATADANTFRLLSIEAKPRVLPFAECPGAALNVSRLVGSEMSALRETVLGALKGTAGCTHLNDALRALAEVPALVKGGISSDVPQKSG
jgi:hypothetical protein